MLLFLGARSAPKISTYARRYRANPENRRSVGQATGLSHIGGSAVPVGIAASDLPQVIQIPWVTSQCDPTRPLRLGGSPRSYPRLGPWGAASLSRQTLPARRPTIPGSLVPMAAAVSHAPGPQARAYPCHGCAGAQVPIWGLLFCPISAERSFRGAVFIMTWILTLVRRAISPPPTL